MSYTAESGRLQILDDAAAAAEQMAVALSAAGEAYEHLDEQAAERMESNLFRPLQAAYGQLNRTVTEFAGRYGLPDRQPGPPNVPLPGDPRRMLERAAESIDAADETLSELQDSLLPVEVGDEELRAGLSRTRRLLAPLSGASAELVRTLGR